MKTNLFSLLKVSFLQTFDFRKSTKHSKSNKDMSFIVLFSIVLVVGLALSFFYACSLMGLADLYDIDRIKIVYSMVGLGSILAIVTSVMKVKTTLFAGNDYDMLASLPLKKSVIISAKFLSLYLTELFYCFLLIFPASLLYMINTKEVFFVFEMLLLILFSPILPLIISSVIGVLISLISDRFKFGNIISVFLFIGFMVVVIYSSMLLQSVDSTGDYQSIDTMFDTLIWINPSTKILQIINVTGLNLLAYVGINLVSLVIAIVLLGTLYDYIHLILTSTSSNVKYVEKDLKPQKQFKALFFMDVKRYVSSKAYLLNTIMSGVMCIIIVVVMQLSLSGIDEPDVVQIIQAFGPIYVVIMLFMIGIATPSSCAINVEGKNFWLIKTMPISYKKYCFSKILLSLLFLSPFVLVSSFIVVFTTTNSPLVIVGIFLFPQLFLLGISTLGIVVNSHFSKIKWTNEIEAVKNSKSVVLSMLCCFLLSIVFALLYLGLGYINEILGFVVSLVYLLTFLVVVFTLFNYKVSTKIQSIEI